MQNRLTDSVIMNLSVRVNKYHTETYIYYYLVITL